MGADGCCFIQLQNTGPWSASVSVPTMQSEVGKEALSLETTIVDTLEKPVS